MKRLSFLLPLVACNQVFGLEETTLDPGSGSPRCPAVGAGAPSFTMPPKIIEGTAGCTSYNFDTNRTYVVAQCGDRVMSGPLDGPLTMPVRFETAIAFQTPRIAPDGRRLFVRRRQLAYYFSELERGVDDVWFNEVSEPQATTSTEGISTPASLFPPRILVLQQDGVIVEVERDADTYTWAYVADYTASELGASTLADPYLSPDGKRMLFVDGARVMYLDRERLSDPFPGPAREVSIRGAPPSVTTPFLLPDCERLYFSTGEGVAYVDP